jgi:hypothetical protein
LLHKAPEMAMRLVRGAPVVRRERLSAVIGQHDDLQS